MSKTISSNTTVAHYKIVSKLGEGGMGEVYLAQDTKLDRKVALKVLPTELATHGDRMRRFVQEAKAAAALNHPNIAHVYDIGENDGIHFIAMEFVEGHTLRTLIHSKHTDLAKLLRYLQHAAEGLAKAHAAGIVHRDLKPDNIMITREGHAKILDFGLAKLIEQRSHPTLEHHADSEIATAILQQHSTPGAILGTVGYMSPEQAQGKTAEIDHRTDIFSFGCILYEAITRHQACDGKGAIDSLNKIIREPSAPISTFNPAAPADLQRIVRRCLAKDAEERYQTIKDVAIEIKEVRRELQRDPGISTTVPPPSGTVTTGIGEAVSTHTASAASSLSSASHPSSAEYMIAHVSRHKIGVAIVLALIVVGLIGGGYAIYRLAKPDKIAATSSSMKISRLVTGEPSIAVASISPDGKYVAYGLFKNGAVSLHVRQVSTGSDREIVAPIADGDIGGTVFSPDGELVYYRLSHRELSPLGTLYQVPVIGGRESKKIIENLSNIISFAPDGKRFVFRREDSKSNESMLMIGSLQGGEPRLLAKRGGQERFLGVPVWSPDATKIVCGAGTITGGIKSTLVEIPAEGGSEKPITKHIWYGAIYRPTWLKDGSGLLVNAREMPNSPSQIWRVSYPAGTVTRITNELTRYGEMSFGLTADSTTLVTAVTEDSARIWVTSRNEGEGQARRLTNGKSDGLRGINWTADGRVVYVARSGDNEDIWITNVDGSGQRQLTSNTDVENGPVSSPDDRYIFFTSYTAGGVPRIWRMDVDGSNAKQLIPGDALDFDPKVSPDGKWLVFGSARSSSPRTWKVSTEGGEPVQLNDLAFVAGDFLPDGKVLYGRYFDDSVRRWRPAIVSFETGQLVKVFDVPQRATDWVLTDERTIIYSEERESVDNLWSMPIEGGTATQLTKFTSESIFTFNPSRDGKRFVLVRGTSSTEIVLIKGF